MRRRRAGGLGGARRRPRVRARSAACARKRPFRRLRDVRVSGHRHAYALGTLPAREIAPSGASAAYASAATATHTSSARCLCAKAPRPAPPRRTRQRPRPRVLPRHAVYTPTTAKPRTTAADLATLLNVSAAQMPERETGASFVSSSSIVCSCASHRLHTHALVFCVVFPQLTPINQLRAS